MDHKCNVNLDDCLVATFSTGERTASLTELTFRKLGFKNFILLEGSDGLRDKFFKLAEIANDTDYQYYIQNDADRYVFEGFYELLNHVEREKTDSSAGVGFDYMMNRFRGATPNVFSRRALVYLHNNQEVMPDVQKPLTAFGSFLQKSKDFVDKDFNVFTNLHDYDQFPSKICNTFLNRLFRGHLNLYDRDHLNNLPAPYKRAVQHAFFMFEELEEKKTIDYMDFNFLDAGYPIYDEGKHEETYSKYKLVYDELTKSFK